MQRAFFVLALAPFAIACSSSVATQTSNSVSGSSSASGAGGAASSSSTSGNGGMGGTGGMFVSSSSTGAGGTSPACATAFIDVDGDGPTQHYVGSCANTWGSNESSVPVAYFVDGPHFQGQLVIQGCLQTNGTQPLIRIQAGNVDSMMPGTSLGAVDQYTDANGQMYSETQKAWDETITKITEKTGETVEGKFQGSVAGSGGILMLTGSFRACKVTDESIP